MSASYPGTLKSYTNKTNKVDLVDAAHINSVQDEIVAIQTELGVDPAGSCTDLKTRLYVCLDNDGAIRKGTSMPGSPIAGQLFWRIDESTLYIRTASAWQSLGANLSNTVFCFSTGGSVQGTTYSTVKVIKFKKIAGISTVTFYANCKKSYGDAGSIKVDIGGQYAEAAILWDYYVWTSASIDVSGLTNGTVYDVTIQIKAGHNDYTAYLAESIGIGS